MGWTHKASTPSRYYKTMFNTRLNRSNLSELGGGEDNGQRVDVSMGDSVNRNLGAGIRHNGKLCVGEHGSLGAGAQGG
jgi:hypothetical protein